MGPILAAPDLARHLLRGEPALFPTDTLPALAAVPAAAAALWTLKQRPAEKPLILMAADLPQLLAWLGETWPAEPPPAWLEQASRCWPGAVTLVLPLRGARIAALNPTGGSLGLRIPACEAARQLLRLSGPLATTSANPSGQEAARDAADAATLFPELPLLGPLPWPQGSGRASTVLAWQGGADRAGSGAWRTLRPGDGAGAGPVAGTPPDPN